MSITYVPVKNLKPKDIVIWEKNKFTKPFEDRKIIKIKEAPLKGEAWIPGEHTRVPIIFYHLFFENNLKYAYFKESKIKVKLRDYDKVKRYKIFSTMNKYKELETYLKKLVKEDRHYDHQRRGIRDNINAFREISVAVDMIKFEDSFFDSYFSDFWTSWENEWQGQVLQSINTYIWENHKELISKIAKKQFDHISKLFSDIQLNTETGEVLQKKSIDKKALGDFISFLDFNKKSFDLSKCRLHKFLFDNELQQVVLKSVESAILEQKSKLNLIGHCIESSKLVYELLSKIEAYERVVLYTAKTDKEWTKCSISTPYITNTLNYALDNFGDDLKNKLDEEIYKNSKELKTWDVENNCIKKIN